MVWVVMGFVGQTERPGSRWVWRPAAFLLSAACASLSVAPAMAATKAPEVEYQDASHVSTTGATIEVPINPEGGETSYEIWLECQNAPESNHSCEPLTVAPQRQEGILPPDFEPQIVTDAVTGLQPGYSYSYGVIATNSAGRAGVLGDGFVTCPSQGPCPSQRYMPGLSLWVIEGAERVAKERFEAERRARQSAEERSAREAEERAAKEREAREAGEHIGEEAVEPVASAHLRRCIVPGLEGDSLTEARRALGRAHCRLGRLTEPRGYRGPLVVVRQGVRNGSKLAAGSRVALTLSRAGKR
jgi:hypothetical protein